MHFQILLDMKKLETCITVDKLKKKKWSQQKQITLIDIER